MQLRRDTAANWTSNNPTLSAGEMGYETDTGKFKIGDGSTAWTSLAYKSSTGLTSIVEDTTPELGGEMDAGAHTIGFTETDNGDSSTADTINWTLSNKQKSTLTGVCTFTFTAPSNPCNLLLRLVQDATGSRTVTWPATVKWPSGTAPTLTTTASAIDIISFYWDGTSYYGMAGLAFSVPA